MQLRTIILSAVVVAAGLGPAGAEDTVRQVVSHRVEPFALADVQLRDGPFLRARELDRAYLRSLDADRLLHTFRLNAGLPSSAEPLGGWEEPKCELRGHFLGHYLSACALLVAGTGDEELRRKADTIVAELAKCQEKMGNGYLSAFPEEFIDRVEQGRPVWAPWYTLHKIYAGLLDMYVLCGNRQALDVLERAGEWIRSRTGKLTDEQMERMLGNEHGGMNDVLAELAAVTGKPQWLALSQRFNHHAVLDPLARREDPLTGLHANTQFPKILGAARQYELTGREDLHTIATFFWDVVTGERSYVIGGNSDFEHFSPKEELSRHIGPNTTETCNTYNMLKITRQLFLWDPRPEYADFYERGLFNHILASQEPETGMVCYYVPLKTGCEKHYSEPTNSFWCCCGTGVENHAKYADSIYFHQGDRALYVNLFIASELAWKGRGVVLRQETDYPHADSTRLRFTCERPTSLELCIRHPFWAVSGIEVSLNGAKVPVESRPGSYVRLTRDWTTGDQVEVRMPMSVRTEAFRDDPNKLAVCYGPLVLCAPLEPGQPAPWIVGQVADIPQAVTPVAGKPLTFRLGAGLVRRLGDDSRPEVVLEPFVQKAHGPYAVYWDVVAPDQWPARDAAFRKEQAVLRELDARTVDKVAIGDQASEAAHHVQGEKTGAGPYEGRQWRHATDGGWFSYTLKTPGTGPAELRCTYWGSDGGQRVFDILVDGEKIATQQLQQNRPGAFYDEVYALPAELLQNKPEITVRFQAHPGAFAGGLFGLRLMRPAP